MSCAGSKGDPRLALKAPRWVAEQTVDWPNLRLSNVGVSTKSGAVQRTKNLRAIQLLMGHTKRESTVRYLGIEVDDALEIAEQTEV